MNTANHTLAGAAALASLVPATVLVAPAVASDAEVSRLLDAVLESDRRANPIGASLEGDRRFDDRWPDVSPAGIAARRAETEAFLERARAIEPGSDRTRVDLELLTFELEDRLASFEHETWQMPLTQQSGPLVSYPQLGGRLSFTEPGHYEDYLARLERLPGHLEQLEANMRAGLAAGRTPPAIVLRDVPRQTAAVAHGRFGSSPSQHPMFEPFTSPDCPPAIRARALDVTTRVVVPAWRRFADFVIDEYLPGARETIGAEDLPGGDAYYASRLRGFTTLDLTAEEIHRIGLAEVDRIRGEMFGVIRETGFEAERPDLTGEALFEAFTGFLRSDERFYHQTPEALLTHYRDICKRVDAELPKLFTVLPRLSYGVRPLPDFVAPSAPTAYYYPGSLDNGVAGYFMANTYNLKVRPKYEALALALHEAVPGHHFQIALAQELEERGLHEWRTTLGFTAFVEGWALYAERLGLEVGPDPERGMYGDPYDEFGRLSYEMWRAMRLVVDTGVHSMGWSRDRAIAYMKANSALTEANIVSEVDRYIAWPGQATGYKIGEIFIRDLRALAEAELGEGFDLRRFHDHVLAAGATTLPVLERRMMEWIKAEKARHDAS